MILIDHTNYDRQIELKDDYGYIPKQYAGKDLFGHRCYIRGWMFFNKFGGDRFYDASFHPEIEEGNMVYYKGNDKVFTIIKNLIMDEYKQIVFRLDEGIDRMSDIYDIEGLTIFMSKLMLNELEKYNSSVKEHKRYNGIPIEVDNCILTDSLYIKYSND